MNASRTPPQGPAAAANAADWRIDRERAVALFGAHAHDWPIEIVEETGSTNADLMSRVKALPRKAGALPRPIVRVAYLQTAGRGRRGRPWYAEPGNALLFSVACVLRASARRARGIEPSRWVLRSSTDCVRCRSRAPARSH